MLLAVQTAIVVYAVRRNKKQTVSVPPSDWEAAQYLLHHFRSRKTVDDLMDMVVRHRSTLTHPIADDPHIRKAIHVGQNIQAHRR